MVSGIICIISKLFKLLRTFYFTFFRNEIEDFSIISELFLIGLFELNDRILSKLNQNP